MDRRIGALAQDIRDGLRARPGRVGLAFFAIAVGITSLTGLVAALRGLQEKADRMVQELGADVFGIVQEGTEATVGGHVRWLDTGHLRLLAANLPGSLVTGTRTYAVSAPGDDRELRAVGTDSALFRVRQWSLSAGRFLQPPDIANGRRCMVISETLSREWNWNVGETITLMQVPFQIVGIVEGGAGALVAEAGHARLALGERVAFIPRALTAGWEEDAGAAQDRLDAVFVRVGADRAYGASVGLARHLLGQPDQRLSGLSWITPETLLENVTRLQNMLKATVGSVAVLCLLLGGTTLMSLMVANVRERVSEIGLRRTLGATTADIAALFVWESTLVTAAAACVGATLTQAVLYAARRHFPIPLHLGFATWCIPVLVAIGLGVAFSYGPARFAARIAPADALRNE